MTSPKSEDRVHGDPHEDALLAFAFGGEFTEAALGVDDDPGRLVAQLVECGPCRTFVRGLVTDLPLVRATLGGSGDGTLSQARLTVLLDEADRELRETAEARPVVSLAAARERRAGVAQPESLARRSVPRWFGPAVIGLALAAAILITFTVIRPQDEAREQAKNIPRPPRALVDVVALPVTGAERFASRVPAEAGSFAFGGTGKDAFGRGFLGALIADLAANEPSPAVDGTVRALARRVTDGLPASQTDPVERARSGCLALFGVGGPETEACVMGQHAYRLLRDLDGSDREAVTLRLRAASTLAFATWAKGRGPEALRQKLAELEDRVSRNRAVEDAELADWRAVLDDLSVYRAP